MDREDIEILSRFETVWQRVQREQNVPTEADDGGIEAVLNGLHYRWHGARQLAMCTCGWEKNRLLRLSDQIKKQFQTLQLRYFLKEGDLFMASARPNFASYTPYNLRKLWQSTVENAESVRNCNLKGDAVFVAELLAIEEAFQHQKEELELLIGRLLQ